jgi:hypothetical protein
LVIPKSYDGTKEESPQRQRGEEKKKFCFLRVASPPRRENLSKALLRKKRMQLKKIVDGKISAP